MNAEATGGETYRLRPIGDGDEAFLFELFVDTRGSEFSRCGLPREQMDQLLRLQYRAQREGYARDFPSAEHKLIEVGGHLVGRLLVDRCDTEIRLVDIALLSSCRDRGVGSAVLRALLDEAGAAGKPVRLHVAQGNPARRWYERHGFVVVDEQPMYLFMEWGGPDSSA